MNGREIQFIPDRLIDEPVVFWGLTDTEIVFSVVGSVIFLDSDYSSLLLPFNKALFGIGFGFGIAPLLSFSGQNYARSEAQDARWASRNLPEKNFRGEAHYLILDSSTNPCTGTYADGK